jgi:HAMP domain-containing protein
MLSRAIGELEKAFDELDSEKPNHRAVKARIAEANKLTKAARRIMREQKKSRAS